MTAKYSAPDNLWTLLQTWSTRGLAAKLGVDRRTIQRWKNQGQKPVPKNEKLLTREAAASRRGWRQIARSRYQHTPFKKLAVQLPTLRGYVPEELKDAAEFEKLKARAKADPKYRFDRFRTARDKRGRKHYFRYQSSGSFQYDVQRAPDSALVAALMAHRGENRYFSISYRVTKPYQKDNGDEVVIGSHGATAYESLDASQFDTPEKIQDFLNRQRAGRRYLTIRITDTSAD